MTSQLERDIIPHLDFTPRTAIEIARRVDCWSDSSVKSSLDRFVRHGIAVKGRVPHHTGYRSIYRRAG